MVMSLTELVNTGEITDLKGNKFSSDMLNLRFFWLAKRRHLKQEPGPQEADSASRYTFLTVFSTSQT